MDDQQFREKVSALYAGTEAIAALEDGDYVWLLTFVTPYVERTAGASTMAVPVTSDLVLARLSSGETGIEQLRLLASRYACASEMVAFCRQKQPHSRMSHRRD